MLILTLKDLNAWHGDNLQLDIPNNTDRKDKESTTVLRLEYHFIF